MPPMNVMHAPTPQGRGTSFSAHGIASVSAPIQHAIARSLSQAHRPSYHPAPTPARYVGAQVAARTKATPPAGGKGTVLSVAQSHAAAQAAKQAKQASVFSQLAASLAKSPHIWNTDTKTTGSESIPTVSGMLSVMDPVRAGIEGVTKNFLTRSTVPLMQTREGWFYPRAPGPDRMPLRPPMGRGGLFGSHRILPIRPAKPGVKQPGWHSQLGESFFRGLANPHPATRRV